jgi:ArsR family transcriptional regulator, arsenate/arsenite/antimonite-responsive transcriptional repressor
MLESQAILALSSLAQESRLAIIRILIKAGEAGLPSGELATMVGVSTASMSFHLGHLQQAGLVNSRRSSRHIIYSAAYERLGGLIKYLMEDCCSGDPRVKRCC